MATLSTPLLKRHVQWYLRRILSDKQEFAVNDQALIQKYSHDPTVSTYLLNVLPAFREYSSFLHQSFLSGEFPAIAPIDNLEGEAERVTVSLKQAYLKDPSRKVLDLFIPRPPTDLFQRVVAAHETLRPIAGDAGPRGLGPLDVVVQLAHYMETQTAFLDFTKSPLTRRAHWYDFPAPKGSHIAHVTLTIVEDAIAAIRRSAKQQQIHFRGDGEIRCFYNVMNLLLHHIVLSGRLVLSPKQWDLVFAVSALHVVQDDYVDGAGANPEVLTAIARKLRGFEVETPNDEAAAPIFHLIDLVYRHLPPAKNPKLVEIFCALHENQLRSMKQLDSPRTLTEQELLRITFMKGGYAFALYGYVALETMTVPQFRHFFAMGAVFQLMDDLHDVDDDLQSSTDTMWTREKHSGRPLDNVLLRTLATQRELENLTGGTAGFRYPKAVRGVERIGARYDTFRFTCMNLHRFSKSFSDDLFSRFPFPVNDAVEFFRHTREHETLDNYKLIIAEIRAEFMGGRDKSGTVE